MTETEDIRDKVNIVNEDIAQLNFIKASTAVVFRRHCRQGLRSRIMEVLAAEDVRKETAGELVDGIRIFPRARPLKMLRIFTRRFDCLGDALQEARKYAVIQRYLGFDLIAASSEFVVDYVRPGDRRIVLCGLQDAVAGEILDPWRLVGYQRYLRELCRSLREKPDARHPPLPEIMLENVRKSADLLISRLKLMIHEAGCIPDLSGIGNLMLSLQGEIRLVDINNISDVVFDETVSTDDKGYPVCDKSIEVMAIIEGEILHRPIEMREKLYGTFLNASRVRKVKTLEERFYEMRKRDEMN